MLRCWVDDSTAAGKGEGQGLAVWIAATRGFEDMEQGDGAKVNRTKSGVLCSHGRLQRLVEQAAAVRANCRYGLVVVCGPVEPPNWEAQWREGLGAPARTVFRRRSSGGEVEELASSTTRQAAEAAAAALAAKEAADAARARGPFSNAEAALAPTPCPDLATLADTPAAAELEAASEQPRGAAGLPHSARLEQLAREAEEAAVAAAAEAGRAAGRAAAAAEAAVDRRARRPPYGWPSMASLRKTRCSQCWRAAAAAGCPPPAWRRMA